MARKKIQRFADGGEADGGGGGARYDAETGQYYDANGHVVDASGTPDQGTNHEYQYQGGANDFEKYTDGLGDLARQIGRGEINTFNPTAPSVNFTTDPNQYQHADYTGDMRGQIGNAAQDRSMANATAARQSALADALQAQSEGRGPSLAQLQLQQATDRNAKQAAGAVASMRGVNPGLAARIAAQQRGEANMDAAGKSAALRMQEQMQARGLLAQALSAQRGQDLGQQGQDTGMFGALGQVQHGQDSNTLGAYGQQLAAAQENARLIQGAQQMQANAAAQNAQFKQALIGGALSGISGGIASSGQGGSKVPSMGGGGGGGGGADSGGAAEAASSGSEAWTGGEITKSGVRKYEEGGEVDDYSAPPQTFSAGSADSLGYDSAGDRFRSDQEQRYSGMNGDAYKALDEGAAEERKRAFAKSLSANSGKADFGDTGNTGETGGVQVGTGVDGRVGGWELGKTYGYAARKLISAFFKNGGEVPGKAQVGGDSPKNDTVPAILSPGEIVLPRSVAKADDAPERAADFVREIKRRKESETGAGYGRVLAKQRELAARMAALESKVGGGR